MITGQVVRREKAKLEACMTCPLCKNLFKEATTISECLHTFCKKCINEKIIDEELDCCPVCNIHLGVAPVDKLRPDHNWEDIRAKLFPPDRKKFKTPPDLNVQLQDIRPVDFPSERRKVKAPADDNVQDVRAEDFRSESKKVKAPAVSSVPLPAKRKERYLSSLVTNAPRISARSDMSGRRRYPTRRNFTLQECSTSTQEPNRKERDFLERLKSPETPQKDAACTQLQPSSIEGSSKQPAINKGVEHAQPSDGKADLWKPLNRLVDAASKTNSDKLNMQPTVVKSVLPDALDNETLELKAIKDHDNKSNVAGNENEPNSAPSGSVTLRKAQRGRKRKSAVAEGLNINLPAQYVVDANNKCDRRSIPIWFTLIASTHQEGFPPLPQIPSCYLRVKDSSLPASFIKKYLVRKLALTSEAEVEISLRGQPIIPTLQLHNLVDLWLRTTPATQKIQASTGSSAQQYMMVLTYGRKTQLP